MSAAIFNPGARIEKRNLLTGFIGLSVMAGFIAWLTGWVVFPSILAGMAILQFIGWIAYPLAGRTIFLLFALLAHGISLVISWLAIWLMYLIGIVLCGSALRLFGMNRLERSFAAARRKETMFHDAPATDAESFWRQS